MVGSTNISELFPFKSQYLSIDTKKNRLHYVSQGKGETILCLHGNPTWSFYFRNVIKELSSSYRIIAYDHLGCGLSSKPQNYAYCLEKHIKNLDQFINKLGLDNITLLVHDWGGPIGIGWATKNIRKIKRLIITNTAAYVNPDIPKRISILKTPFIGEFLIRKFNVFAKSATFMASYKELSKDTKKGLLKPYDSFENRIGIARFVQDIPMNKNHPSYQALQKIENNLHHIQCPTLILWGMKDFCFHPGFLQRWKTIYSQAKIVELHQASHYLFEDVPDKINHEIQTFMNES